MTVVFVAALLYSAIAVGVSWLRGADDELNTLFSGASAGMIYYASGKWFAYFTAVVN